MDQRRSEKAGAQGVAMDTLFSTTPVLGDGSRHPPLIVVGLPRSGSSFFSHILSQIPDWYVFDDLYLHRRALALGATGPLSDEQLDKLLHFLGWQIRARLKFGLYAIPNVAEPEVERMNAALKAAFSGKGISWAELQEEWMTRLGRRANCTRWGYKMPQAFVYMEDLRRCYPGVKIIYLMRHPSDVLASFKHMTPDSQDGNPRQYHPLVYAYYWRAAMRSYRSNAGEALLEKFEDLVSNPLESALRVADFIGATRPESVDTPQKANTSFSGKKIDRSLSGLETWLLNRIAGEEMRAAGYELRAKSVKLGDFVDFMRVSLVFARYRLQLLLNGSDKIGVFRRMLRGRRGAGASKKQALKPSSSD
jgi:hypothetical protein